MAFALAYLASAIMHASVFAAGGGNGYLLRRWVSSDSLSDVFPNVGVAARPVACTVPLLGLALMAYFTMSGWTAGSRSSAPGRMLESMLRNSFVLGAVLGGVFSHSHLDMWTERAGTLALSASFHGVVLAWCVFRYLESKSRGTRATKRSGIS